jgi:hypothetical protein
MRADTIKEWIAKELVPVKSKVTLYDLIKKLNNKAEMPSCWGKTGRPRLVEMDALPRLVSALDSHKGLSINLEEVEAAIVQVRGTIDYERLT